MNGIESLKRRTDALAQKDGGNIVLIYHAEDQPDDRVVEYVLEVKKHGEIPIILDEKDRNL